MKIVIAAPHYPPRFIGGTEKIAHRMAHSLLAKGHQVAVVCVDLVNSEPDAPVCVREDENGVIVHRLAFNIDRADDRLQWGFRNPLIRSWFDQYLNEEKPDIVHLLSGYLISGSILESAHAHQIPTIVTLLDFWFVCPQITLQRTNGSLCHDPVPASRCAWCLMSAKRRYRYLDQRMGGIPGNVVTFLGQNPTAAWMMNLTGKISTIEERRSYLHDLLENANVVITHSHFLQKKMSEYGISTRNMVYLPNGIDFGDGADINEIRANQQPLRIGYLGQIAHHKGVHVLVNAFIAAEILPERAELHIYGNLDQWPQYSSQLRKAIQNHSAIFLEGPYRSEELDRVLDGLDIIVVPSIWYENRPTVVLEAFARGKPVIASNLGGMAEMVEDGADGLLFKPDHVGDLADKLLRVVEPGQCEKLTKGIGRVKGITEEMDEIEELYNQVLSNRELIGNDLRDDVGRSG